MYQSILDVFPEIDLIEDQTLKQKVIDVFKEGIAYQNWKFEAFSDMPYTVSYVTSVPFRQHVRAVTALAVDVYDLYLKMYPSAKQLNRDYLIAGALLHDVGKLMEITVSEEGVAGKSSNGKLLRHAFTGVGLAMKHGIPDEVLHVIAVHSREGDGGYRSPIADLIRRSDQMNEFLSQI
jgi:putative nucleotidyltransferase with HDIG domain